MEYTLTILAGYILLVGGVGLFAKFSRFRSGLGWIFIAVFTTPIIAIILLIILPALDDPENIQSEKTEKISEKKAKIEEFDFLKQQLLSLYEKEPNKFANNEVSIEMINRLKKMEEWDFDLDLANTIKTMLAVLK